MSDDPFSFPRSRKAALLRVLAGPTINRETAEWAIQEFINDQEIAAAYRKLKARTERPTPRTMNGAQVREMILAIVDLRMYERLTADTDDARAELQGLVDIASDHVLRSR